MKSTVIFISFLLCLISSIFGQRNLTKEEIRRYWIGSEKPADEDSIIVRVDTQTNYVIRDLIDSLRHLKIDSIIVYSISYPGYIGKSTCIIEYYPTYTYLIWKANGQTVVKKIEGKCLFDEKNIKTTILFDFYDKHKEQITKEYIMPVIYSGRMDTNNTVSSTGSLVDHEPKYFLYFSFGKDSRVLEFAENDLQDKKSLFYEDNLNSKLYLWWKIIDSEMAMQ